MTFKLPGEDELGFCVATEQDIELYEFFGGQVFGGVGFTRDQYKAIYNFYGFSSDFVDAIVEEGRSVHADRVKKHAEEEDEKRRNCYGSYMPDPPPKFNERGIRKLVTSGGSRNMFRDVQRDGLRVMAFMAPFLEHGEDPVVLVARALAAAGYEVAIPDDDAQNEER